MITVMRATGHTGKRVTEALLNTGQKVRALGRSESKLAELKSSVAEVAARALTARDWKGVVVRELLGPRDLSYREATRILGERIERREGRAA